MIQAINATTYRTRTFTAASSAELLSCPTMKASSSSASTAPLASSHSRGSVSRTVS